MREIECIAFFKAWFQLWPDYPLRSIRYQILNDSTFFYCFLNREECLTWYKTICNSLIPVCFELRSLTDYYIDTVIFHVHSLCRPLNTITNYSDDFILKNFAGFRKWKLCSCYYIFDYTAKINFC